MLSFAQNFEDVYIGRAFRDVEAGFFVDIGVYHPEIASVTKHFYDLGWHGINVEPGDTYALFEVRQRDINLKLAISDSDGEISFFYHDDDPGTSTILPKLAPELTERVYRRRPDTVPCITLEHLIDNYAAGQHIHFLKIDIEGAEECVIKSTDWSRYRPELLVVEATRPYTNVRCDTWGEYLKECYYYEVFFDGINLYYLRQESLARRHAFDRPVNALDQAERVEPTQETIRLRARVAELELLIGDASGGTTVINAAPFLDRLDVRGPVKIGDSGLGALMAFGDVGAGAAECGVYVGRRGDNASAPGSVLHLGGFDGVCVHTGDTLTQPSHAKVSVSHEVVRFGVSIEPALDRSLAIGSPEHPFDVLYAKRGPILFTKEADTPLSSPCDLGLDFIRSLKPLGFQDTNGVGDSRLSYGLSPSEVGKVLADRNRANFALLSETKDHRIGLQYDQLIPCLILAVNELAAEVDRVQATRSMKPAARRVNAVLLPKGHGAAPKAWKPKKVASVKHGRPPRTTQRKSSSNR